MTADADGARSSIALRCACGWEMAGDTEAVVAAAQDHGRRVHNMAATREQVLAMAVEPSSAASTSDPPRPEPPSA
jgi:hypothetical protein